jgi:hypothetical protein
MVSLLTVSKPRLRDNAKRRIATLTVMMLFMREVSNIIMSIGTMSEQPPKIPIMNRARPSKNGE